MRTAMQTVHNVSTLPATPADPIERLMAELEMIGYVTSHDLQSPLRAIQSCCEELNANPAVMKDKTAGESVRMMSSEAARMKTMLQGLLEYVRLDTFATASALLDANELYDTALITLSEEISATGADITKDPLPQVYGHRGRLTRLFAFLLDNAIKFHGTQKPRIHVSAKRVGDMWQFCIEDNGIGVDEEHREIIFSLFQRLHTQEAIPGHGIGLALARKLAQAHGGTVWMEPAPSGGSRFYFTLPDNKKQA